MGRRDRLMFTKICGVTTVGDALAAVNAGADAIGLNFVPTSSRLVDRVTANAIVQAVRGDRPDVMLVGVFSDHPVADVSELANLFTLDAVQLHGTEAPGELAVLVESLAADLTTIKVFAPDRFADIGDYDCDVVMLDAPTGGGGHSFDWDLIGDLTSRYRVLLAGGLTPHNVAAAIATARPWGVDVASGVESSPGHKDATLMGRFVDAAHAAV